MTRRILFIALGLIISISALTWAVIGIDWQQLALSVSMVPIWTPLLAIATYLLSFIPRAYRLTFMLADTGTSKVSLGHAAEAQVMGYAANNLLPLRLGELVRVFVLHRLAQIPRFTGLASLLAERILDGLMIVLILGGTVSLFAAQGTHFGETAVNPLLYTGSALFAVATVALVVISLMTRKISQLTETYLPQRFHAAVANILIALELFSLPKRALCVIGLSALVWLLEGCAFVLVIASLGIEEPWVVGYFMLAIVNLGILLPSAPGYVGVFQACGILAFQVLGLPREQGLASSVLIHICQFLPITIIGLWLASRHGWNLSGMAKTQSKTIS